MVYSRLRSDLIITAMSQYFVMCPWSFPWPCRRPLWPTCCYWRRSEWETRPPTAVHLEHLVYHSCLIPLGTHLCGTHQVSMWTRCSDRPCILSGHPRAAARSDNWGMVHCADGCRTDWETQSRPWPPPIWYNSSACPMSILSLTVSKLGQILRCLNRLVLRNNN